MPYENSLLALLTNNENDTSGEVKRKDAQREFERVRLAIHIMDCAASGVSGFIPDNL